ncbi:MAG: prepilin peptidase [Acholeplasmataceae bacterium]
MIYIIILGVIMYWIAVIDIKHGLIPWQLLCFGFITILIQYIIENQSIIQPLMNSLVVTFSLHSFRLLLNAIYHKDTLGMGDIHLLAVIAFGFNDIGMTLYVLAIGSYIALFFMLIYKKKQVSFGPFLLLSTLGVMMYQIFFS